MPSSKRRFEGIFGEMETKKRDKTNNSNFLNGKAKGFGHNPRL
jgi:hypothetical protein